MALGAFAGAMLALSPTLAAFTATVGASSTLTAGASPTLPDTPVVPFVQLSLAPVASVLYEGRKADLQATYTPSFTWMPVALPSQGTTFLSHNGQLSYAHRSTPRFQSSVQLGATVGSLPQFQLRNPNSLALGATAGGTGRMETLSFSGSAGSRYLFTRRWSYAGTLTAQVFEADNGSGAGDQQTNVLAPQRTVATQQTVDYALSASNTLGVNASAGLTRNGVNDLVTSALTLSHRRQVGVVSELTLTGGIANFSALPGSVANPGQERTSGTALVMFSSEGGIGLRRATYDISLQWAPGVDVVLGQTRDRARLLFNATLPLDANLTAGVSAQVSTATDQLPFDRQNAQDGSAAPVGATPGLQAGPLDETLFYLTFPFTYALNEEWSLNWGGTASFTAPHWRLPFELNNPYYAAFVGVGFRIPVYQTR